jgi:hypothetical protein
MKRFDNKEIRVLRPLERTDSGTALVKEARGRLFDEMIESLRESTGTHSDDVADRIVWQAATAQQAWPETKDENGPVMTAISFIKEMAPQNVTEAMLAVQMIANNDAALIFLHRSTLEDQSTEGADANVLRATRLMRVFTQQAEAMQKLKGKTIQQKLTVEHVNVQQEGPAIVAVSTSKKDKAA